MVVVNLMDGVWIYLRVTYIVKQENVWVSIAVGYPYLRIKDYSVQMAYHVVRELYVCKIPVSYASLALGYEHAVKKILHI